MTFVPLPAGLFPATMQAGYINNASMSTSPLSGVTQVIERPGLKLLCMLGWDSATSLESDVIKAWAFALRGNVNYTALYDFSKPYPRGTLRGVPLINGANQAGESVNLKNCAPGATLLTGDWIGIGGRARMVKADAVATAAGLMTVALAAPLQVAATNDAIVEWDKPTSNYRLRSSQALWENLKGGLLKNLQMDFEEHL
jgi:hypothetical protein